MYWRTARFDFLDNPQTNFDHVFIVGGVPFQVKSGTLSMRSEYFRRMFQGDKKEIEISEVDPELFHKYLMVIDNHTFLLRDVDLIPLIHLSYRFLTPHVMNFCKKFIDENLDKLGPLKLELLRTACLYDNKDLKKKLIDHFMNIHVMEEFKCGEVIDIVVEYNLDDLKAWLGDYMSKNLTYANCVDLLDSSVKFNMPTLKDGICKQIQAWPENVDGRYKNNCVPRNLIIDLAKAAFKHNVESLKSNLRSRIGFFCRHKIRDGHGQYYKHFLTEFHDEMKTMPEDVKNFIILSTADY